VSRPFFLCAVLALALAVSGCSGGNKPAPTPRLTINAEAQYAVKALVSSYEHALRAGDAEAACSDMTPTLQGQIVFETQRSAPSVASCAQAMTLAMRARHGALAAAFGRTVVKSILVSGDRATIVSTRDGKTLATRALREASGWKLDESP